MHPTSSSRFSLFFTRLGHIIRMQKCPLVFGRRISSDSRETTPTERLILDSDFFWHSRFANCCSASVESSAHGVFGCRRQSFLRSAVFLKFWKASSRKQSRPEKGSTGLVGKATNGTRKTKC